MGFSVMVEVLNLRLRQRPAEPIQLRSAYQAGELAPAMAASTAKPGSIKATPKKKAAKKRK